MLDRDACKSDSVRKWIPVFYNLASLESTDKQKGQLADNLFLCFTSYSSAIHFVLTPKQPDIQNSITDRTALSYFFLVRSLACLLSAFLTSFNRCFAKGAVTVFPSVDPFSWP